MKVNTGKGYISLYVLISILALSLVVNLPGLAITPILDTLTREFHASDFEVQLLTMIPNLVIIPFMLMSNYLILKFGKTSTSLVCLAIFAACGALFFLSKSISTLIILSAGIGAAAGVVIPIAASMISDLFVGQYRVKELGMTSGVANLSLVFATFIVGWLANSANWRLPFLVYLIPIIPILFAPGLYKGEKLSAWRDTPDNLDASKLESSTSTNLTSPNAGNSPESEVNKTPEHTPPIKMNKKRLAALMGMYFFITYAIMPILYYLSFDGTVLKIDDEWVSTITSIFFLLMFIGGSALFIFVKFLKQWLMIIAAALMPIGLFFIVSGVPGWAMCIFGAMTGLGYGIIQPLIYDKTAEVAGDKKNSTLALSWVMIMNYIAIAISPFIIDGIRFLFKTDSNIFPFYLNTVLLIAFTIFVILRRNSFAFCIKKTYY